MRLDGNGFASEVSVDNALALGHGSTGVIFILDLTSVQVPCQG